MFERNNLIDKLQRNFTLPESLSSSLKKQFLDGSRFYQVFNTTRLKQAISSFSPDMKKALYDILFFLHVNEPRFQQFTYDIEEKGVAGVKKNIKKESNLYVSGAPSGIAGIDKLSSLIQSEFYEYVQKQFGHVIRPNPNSVFVSIASLGSIGTIAHKKSKSDLDLQIQYSLEPFFIARNFYGDEVMKRTFMGLLKSYSQQLESRFQYSREDSLEKTKVEMRKRFFLLHEFLFRFDEKQTETYLKQFDVCARLCRELVSFRELSLKYVIKNNGAKQEKLIQTKTNKILEYINTRYSQEEVYFFTYSVESYRQGQHGSGLDSKESSGSAYELILNYDTLMPGIHFSGLIPFHYLCSQSLNYHTTNYDFLIGACRLQLLGTLHGKEQFVDLGASKKLDSKYMKAHYPAVYWEAFKGTRGNLPKAFLNLLRLEVLFDEDFQFSVIDMIKNNQIFSEYFPKTLSGAYFSNEEKKAGEQSLSLEQLKQLEIKHPAVRFDPWWLRYKSLKVSFAKSKGRFVESEREQISQIIDLCFAFHIWLADVFEIGNRQSAKVSFRESVLITFYNLAFPQGTKKRENLIRIFKGETSEVNEFEQKLRAFFNASIKRILGTTQLDETEDISEEYKIWSHYCRIYFESKPNMVFKSALYHLKHTRGRLRLKTAKNGTEWEFWSVGIPKPNTQRVVPILGDEYEKKKEILVHENSDFIAGLSHCIFNGYYQCNFKGDIKISTEIELTSDYFAFESDVDRMYASLNMDVLDSLSEQICSYMPYIEVDYRDCIRKKLGIQEVFCLVNVLHYGRIHFVYRDVLGNIYVTFVDSFPIRRRISHYYSNYENLVKSEELFNKINTFLKSHKHSLEGDGDLYKYLYVWVNPLSVLFNRPYAIDERVSLFSQEFKKNFIEYQKQNYR